MTDTEKCLVWANIGHRRTEAALEHYNRTGLATPAIDVLNKLQAMLDARCKQLDQSFD